ncbi:capsule biosynthesis protein [Methylobacterium gossipiicola]|uniref:Capsular polysaccharide transport system permease protein n=1 Tax=Methylobacterium gossipiicola TaxID=582675 RepID=A0A1I2ULJ4_9HYPH|nr:capsule biosynthesis protein [Methylobacterium gossipiicola]SFG76517.1 capsular polysaccharide transport system permease protein [Methylobacterium gossipiicola]
MNVDEVKQSERLRGVLDLALRAVPDLRRNAETVEPIPTGRAPAFLLKAGERLDWRRLPGLRPASSKPPNLIADLIRNFSVFVLLPTLLLAVYFYGFASDQYIAESQFTVRGNVEPMEDGSVGQFADLIQKHNSQDSFIVKNYIQSQTLVAKLEESLKVSAMFSRKEADFWSRYRPPQPIEELTKYWRQHVAARIDVISGIITLSVRAFTPEDALAISKEVIARTEVLINEISRAAQADLVAHAEADAVRAQTRLREAHLALQTFRNRWGIIDPIKTAEATLTTLGSLRKDQLKAETDLQVLRGSNLDEKSRSIQTLVANLAAIQQQIKRLQEQLTTDGLTGTDPSNNMTRALLEYEGLQVEKTIASKLNESANLMVDRARVAATKQQIFLATFVPPDLPSDSLYPHRGYAVSVGFFCFLVVWSSMALIMAGLKDQRL